MKSDQTLRVLHLTDLHIRSSVIARLRERIAQLPAAMAALGAPPDLICITGDLTASGKAAEFDLIESEVIVPLAALVGGNRERLVVVPGNHDVDRSLVDSLTQKGLVQTLSSPDELGDLWREKRSTIEQRLSAFWKHAEQSGVTFRSRTFNIRNLICGDGGASKVGY